MTTDDETTSLLSRYASFEGRLTRAEFWRGYLSVILIIVLGSLVDFVLGTAPVVGLLAFLFTVPPFLGLGARRLHDTGRSAWWLLIVYVPYLTVVVHILWCLDSSPGPNRHGPSPKYGEHPPADAEVEDRSGG